MKTQQCHSKIANVIINAIACCLVASNAMGAITQVFYVPMPEDQIYSTAKNLYFGTGTEFDSTISIAPMQNGTVIYYDHWEDGYESKIEAPTQSTTQVWGDNNPANGIPPGFATDTLNAASVITLRNMIQVPRYPGSQRYDARDKIVVTKPVAVTRFSWPTQPGPVFAGAVQVTSTADYGTDFVCPAGENAPGGAFNQMFEKVSLFVMAAENGTAVQIDADANGSFERTATLGAGETFYLKETVSMGARVLASKPVQVQLIMGNKYATFESRWLNVYPRAMWSSTYYTPVCTTKTDATAATFLFNPNATPLTVNYQTRTSTGSISVPAKGMARYEMPLNTGARFFATGAPAPQFYAFGAMDTDQGSGASNSAHEWGFALVPDTYLTPSIKIGSAPGAGDKPISANGSPVWVTATAATRLYIDYDGNTATGARTDPSGNKYDEYRDIAALESVRIFDNSDRDQTGLRAYTTSGTKITAAWGQDPGASQPGNPFLDLGYTVLPQPLFYASKAASLVFDANGNGYAETNDTIEYTISVSNQGVIAVNASVIDAAPVSTAYINGTTRVNGVSIADDISGSTIPLDGAGLNLGALAVGQTKTVTFRVQVGFVSSGVAKITNTASVSIGDVPTFVTATTPALATQCPTVNVSSTPATAPGAIVGSAYNLAFSATGGQPPYAFAVDGSGLPAGLTLSSAGVLSGIPTKAGAASFIIAATDANQCVGRKTVTFNIVQTTIGLGNLVFFDTNGNGHYDEGEGVNGVTVQLYTSAQTPGAGVPLFSQVTVNGGRYLFGQIPAGSYRVHIPASMFATGAPLASTMSIAEAVSGDDDVGEDGINTTSPATTGISSAVVSLAVGNAPTDDNGETGADHVSDNGNDASIDLTVDFGFVNPLGVGNLIFIDRNLNGHADPGEGAADVVVDLYRAGSTPGVTPPLASQVTDVNGHFLFDYLGEGSYFIHIPASQFTNSGALAGMVSIPGSGTGSGDDSIDEDGLDTLAPHVEGVRSTIFVLSQNAAPVNAVGEIDYPMTENGYLASEDGRDDNNYDLTIDLGFRVPDPNAVGVGNLVFVDRNGNGIADEGEGVGGVTVQIFAAGNVVTAVATAITSADGSYLFSGLGAGSYLILIPSSMFASGAPLEHMLSIVGQGGDNGFDDDQDENGNDPADPTATGVRSSVFTLAPGGEPSGTTSESGIGSYIDDINDASTDLTIDFGFYRPVGVGNLVFVDANRDGAFNAGEGVDGVTVELYRDTQSAGFEPPVASAVTSGGGFYLFNGLKPSFYFAHISTANFAPGGVLAGFMPMRGQGADDGSDDDLDENGSDPAQSFIDGVSSLTFALAVGTEPTNQTTERGAGSTMDDAMDGDVDLTVDFGFAAGAPGSFSQWQAQNPLGGQNGPTFDPDGDGLSNVAEYTFGLPPSTGVQPWCPFEIARNPATGQIDAFVRKVAALDDVSVTLQGLDELGASPGGWFDITTINPEIAGNTGGLEVIAYRNLELGAAFPGDKGFVRLQLALDADHDGTPEATATTEVWGWSRRTLQPQIVTYSNPFLKCAAFTGAVGSVSGNLLDVSAAVGSSAIARMMTGAIPWYIEVISGDNEGHRFEVDELNSTATTIALETISPLNTLPAIPASLAGDRIALRPHWTLAECLPPAAFRATNSSSSADRLMCYTGTAFATTWLFSNGGNPKWVNDATLADRGTSAMDPAEAFLILPRSNSAPIFVNLGIVRDYKFACPIKQGTRLIGGGWPMDQSPASRNMLYANGFTGASSSSRADRILIWTGDTTSEGTTYDTHYLLKTASIQQWVRNGDSTLSNENAASLFGAMHGVFFNSYLGKPDYVAPVPWTP